jgi:hypothetical protein
MRCELLMRREGSGGCFVSVHGEPGGGRAASRPAGELFCGYCRLPDWRPGEALPSPRASPMPSQLRSPLFSANPRATAGILVARVEAD